ncbi:MAG: S53 family peptidase [Candidatus Dormibacteria bacterium]
MPRINRACSLVAAAALAGSACLTFAGTRPASAATADPYLSLTGTTQLTSDVLSGLGNGTVTGVIDPTRTLSIGVTLSRPDPAGEAAYLADVYNPASPNFRHFLSTAGFASRFGVSPERYHRALAWLSSEGLTTTAVPGSSEYVLASGTAAQVEALVGVQIDDYTFRGTSFFANTSAPTVPANLGILDVAGLQNLAHMKTLDQIHRAAVAAGKEPATPARPSSIGPGTNIGATTAQDLWSIYDLPNSNLGQGQSMAIFGWGCTEPPGNAFDAAPYSYYHSSSSPYGTQANQNTSACAGTDLISNLRSNWETPDGLPQAQITINHYGAASDPVNDTSGSGEWQLDMPASTGMAPEATETLYFGNNGQDPDILAAYGAWVADANGPLQGSSSFAGCEATPFTGSQPGGPGNPGSGVIIGNPNQDAYEAVLKEAVALGRTMFNSAGDLGANGCPSNTYTALNGLTPSGTPINNYPSSSDWVTTVSGTVLYWNGTCPTGLTPTPGCATRALENSWTYTGGGTSLYISAPSWQQNPTFDTQSTSAPGVTYPCTTNWEASPVAYPSGTICRGLPDVAAQSGDIISNGSFGNGGTSLSSPLWLGMWTRIQAASSNPGRLGFASPAIYANNATASAYETDFFDVGGSVEKYNGNATNSETNPVCSVNTYFPQYDCSGSGWDFLSGWGTPDVTNLMKDLNGGNVLPVLSGPGTTLPESPASALLPLLGLLGAAFMARSARRRRRARA